MKFFSQFILVVLFLGYCSCALNQETIIQCLKLKSQYPNMNLNCEDLINQNMNLETNNNNNNLEKTSPQVIEEGAQENSNPNPIITEQQTLSKEISPQQIEENNSPNPVQNNEKEFKNLNDLLNKMLLRFDKIDNEHKMILNKLDHMDNEIKLVKSQIEKISLNNSSKNIVSKHNNIQIPNPKLMKRKQIPHIRPNKITLKRRTNFKRQLPLIRKKKNYLKKIIPNRPLPYMVKKNRKRNVNTPNKIQKRTNVQKNVPSNNNGFDIELLKKLIAQQQQQQRTNSNTNIKKVDNPELANEESTSNPQSVPTQNDNNSSNVFQVKKRVVNVEQEKFQHEKHKKLNEEASKLFEALRLLKSKQKGILSNLSVKKTQNDSVLENGEKSNTNNLTNNKTSLSKKGSTKPIDKKVTENITNNDSSLTEIEKQIKLLNSLNTNNSSR